MSLKIALLGSRGIPANYGGFETCAEQLSVRLAARGHDVTVYCRRHIIHYPGDSYKGVRLVKLPTIANKYLDTIVHSLISSLHALRGNYDIALYFIAGNSPVSWIPRLVGTRTLLHVDGLDWKRAKWPAPARKYIQLAEYLAQYLPNAFLTDSRIVQDYYQNQYGRRPHFIAYGSEVEALPPGETLARLGLASRRYVLFVGRLVAENYVHHLVEAFPQLETDMKCVIVGGASYADDYIARLEQIAATDKRIILTGYLFGDGYRELGANAYLFVETSGVGGTHPALIEAMALGNCVVVHDTAENKETIGPAGFAYDGRAGASALAPLLRRLLAEPDVVAASRPRAQAYARDRYSWDAVTDAYERLFYELLGRE